ncbi:hypothetical protein KAR91_57060, partial [Candidatus Pacearchaeota archaeon]|nr:hypothetical protein [Candidatus Pacearchaeota archaeon]
MKPEEIKEIRGKLRQQTFCDELNKIAKTILPDASTINIRSLRNWETENKTNHRDPPEWIRFLIMQYKSKDLKHADICPDCGKGEIKENL